MTCLWTSLVEIDCTKFHMSLFQPLALKMVPQKLKFIHFQPTFMKFNMDTQNEIYDDFPQSPV